MKTDRSAREPSSGESAWEHFAHGADIGIRGRGPSLARALEQAAVALTAVVTDPRRVAARRSVTIEVSAPDPELLLVDWLNALVLEMAIHKMLFARFDVTVTDHHLLARCWGEAVDPIRHQPAVEVKGATYTELAVARTSDGDWVAQCVVDV